MSRPTPSIIGPYTTGAPAPCPSSRTCEQRGPSHPVRSALACPFSLVLACCTRERQVAKLNGVVVRLEAGGGTVLYGPEGGELARGEIVLPPQAGAHALAHRWCDVPEVLQVGRPSLHSLACSPLVHNLQSLMPRTIRCRGNCCCCCCCSARCAIDRPTDRPTVS